MYMSTYVYIVMYAHIHICDLIFYFNIFHFVQHKSLRLLYIPRLKKSYVIRIDIVNENFRIYY